MSEEDPVIVPDFEGIPITLTPEQQEELQKHLDEAWKEFLEELPDRRFLIGDGGPMFSVNNSDPQEQKQYDGGESWMEGFYPVYDLENKTVVQACQNCDWTSGSMDGWNLRDELQMAYTHIETCSGSGNEECGK